jgi:hypothetical protein
LEVVSLRAKFARRAEKQRDEEKRSAQTPSHGNESITGPQTQFCADRSQLRLSQKGGQNEARSRL